MTPWPPVAPDHKGVACPVVVKPLLLEFLTYPPFVTKTFGIFAVFRAAAPSLINIFPIVLLVALRTNGATANPPPGVPLGNVIPPTDDPNPTAEFPTAPIGILS